MRCLVGDAETAVVLAYLAHDVLSVYDSVPSYHCGVSARTSSVCLAHRRVNSGAQSEWRNTTEGLYLIFPFSMTSLHVQAHLYRILECLVPRRCGPQDWGGGVRKQSIPGWNI